MQSFTPEIKVQKTHPPITGMGKSVRFCDSSEFLRLEREKELDLRQDVVNSTILPIFIIIMITENGTIAGGEE